MWTTRAMTAVAIGGVVFSLGLAGCGSKSESNTETATTTATVAEKTQATQAPPSPNAPAKNPTIKSYIDENGITDAPVRRGEPGAPAVELPVPEGWATTGSEDTPDGAYGAIVYTGPDAAGPPPRIVAWYRKLTGNVDPQKVLDVAGGELRNLEGWEPLNDGSTTELRGFPAFQLGGTWVKDGQKQFATQKTVVIPRDGAVFVLKFDAQGLEDQIDIIGPATIAIDDETTITP